MVRWDSDAMQTHAYSNDTINMNWYFTVFFIEYTKPILSTWIFLKNFNLR